VILDYLNNLPAWASLLFWSALILLLTILIGRIAGWAISRWLTTWADTTNWQWDEVAVRAVRRGLPFWSALVGLYVAIGLWPIEARWSQAVIRVIFVVGWLSLTVVAADMASKLVRLYSSQFSPAMPVTSITQNIVKLVIILIGALMVLNGLGIPVAPLLTALGVGGLAVALALQDTLSNLFAGFYLSVSHQVRVGDYVKLDSGQEGYVDDIGWRATKVRMLPNNMVLVPNNKLAQAIIINYYLPSRDLAVTVDLGVAYGSDLARVERVTCEVAKTVMKDVPGGVPEFEPAVRFHTFGDYNIQCTVVLRAKEFADQYLLKHEFIKRLHVRYRAEGIEIPYPTQVAIHRDAR